MGHLHRDGLPALVADVPPYDARCEDGTPKRGLLPREDFRPFRSCTSSALGRGSEAKPPTHSIPFFEYSSCRRHPLRVSSSRTAPLFGARHTDGHVGELLAEGADVPLAGVDVPQARAAAARPRAPGRLRADEGVGNGRKIEAQDFGTDDWLGICGIKVNLYACRTLPGSGVFLYLKQASPIISIFFFSGVWMFVILLCPAVVLLLLGTPLSLRFVMDTYLFLGGVTPMDGGNVDCNSYHAVCIFRDPPK